MDKSRVLRTRKASMLAGEKDRQKRPGTPHRNNRRLNLMRASESAVPLHASFSDRSEDEEFQRKNKIKAKKLEGTHQTDRRSGNENRLDQFSFQQNSSTAPMVENSSSETSVHNLRTKTPTIRSATSVPRGISELEGNGGMVLPQRSRTRLIKSKSNQATNTATTSKGLPPLDGVHAGIGVGPGYCEARYDSRESLSEIYNISEDEEEKEKEMLKKMYRLVVSPTLVFEASSLRNSFGAIINIQNVSEYFISFCVKSSEPEMFVITPNVGMLNPCSNQEVFVKTNPKFEFTFKDIASEVFKIFGTPVYTRSQMKLEKLQVLWKAFGSHFFPRIAAEEHTINFLYQYFPKYTTESLLSAISCNHRWLNSIWGNTKDVRIKPNQISEEEFYNVWPLEDDQYSFMTCKNQMDGWCCYLENMKKQTKLLKYEMRQCFGNCIFIIFASMLVYSSLNPIPGSYQISNLMDWFRYNLNEKCDMATTTPTYWDMLKGLFGF